MFQPFRDYIQQIHIHLTLHVCLSTAVWSSICLHLRVQQCVVPLHSEVAAVYWIDVTHIKNVELFLSDLSVSEENKCLCCWFCCFDHIGDGTSVKRSKICSFCFWLCGAVTYMWTSEALQSSEFICFFQHGWPERARVKLTTWQDRCDALPGPAHKLHALLNFWPFLTACQQLHETPGFYSEVELCLCLCLGVLLHLVWLWAVHLADCYLFCLLMMGACDWWTGSRTSPIDSCW